MRLLLGLFAMMLMVITCIGCDEETQAADASQSDTEQATPTMEVAQPVQQPDQPDFSQMAPDTVLVTVNGDPITNAQVTEALDKQVAAMKQQMPAGQAMPDAQIEQIRVSVMEMLAQKKILEQMMVEKGITVSDEELMQEIAKAAESRGQTLDDIQAEVEQIGMTMEDIKSQVRPQVQMQKLAQAALKEPEMLAKAQAFYADNPSYFEVPEQLRASHVLIEVAQDATEEEKAAARQEAEEVLAKAKAGDDFAALAKEYSDDPGSKDTGGEYTFGRGQMVKPFEDAAFSLEPDEVSDIVETQFGYHIIKLSEKTPASTTPFDEVNDQIASYLIQQQMQEEAVVQYSEAAQALRQKVQQQRMIQQQMMQQIQRQMQQQQAQQAGQEAAAESTQDAGEE